MTGAMAMSKSSVLVKALEIAIVLKEREGGGPGEGLPGAEKIMRWIAGRLYANQMIVF